MAELNSETNKVAFSMPMRVEIRCVSKTKTSPAGSSTEPIRNEVKRPRVVVDSLWLRKGEY